MSMSRKHYTELASILSTLHKELLQPDNNPSISFNLAIGEICYLLKSDNDRFNFQKFREAVFDR